MHALLCLCILTFASVQGFIYFRFDNRCDYTWPIWNYDEENVYRHVFDLPGRETLCALEANTHLRYQFGKNGKLKAEFQVNLDLTLYNINAIFGYDRALRLEPYYFGFLNGTIIECNRPDCPDAVHSVNEFFQKQHKTFGDTMHIILCPERSQEGMNPDCLHRID